MRFVLRQLKKIWFFSFLRRISLATSYFNYKYLQILRWGFESREFTNFTYELTASNLNYLAHLIAYATQTELKKVLELMYEIQNDEILKKHILLQIVNSPEKSYADKEIRFGRRIGWYIFVRILKPQLVVETGVDKGLGSVVLCAALLRNKAEGFEGQYLGTDINPKAGYLLSGEYAQIGKILYGDSIESLKKINQPIDIFINDSDHSADYEYQEYLTIEDKISENSLILGDNAHCTDKLALFSEKTNRHFLFFQEVVKNHWYPGAGIGISFKK